MDSQPGYQAHSGIVTNLNVVASNNLVQSVLTPISSIIKQGNQFSVKLTSGTTGLPLVGRTVAITVNGISYYKVTDSEGIARLTINLNIGTYKITAEFVGDSNYKSSSVYKLIHVPNLLTSNDYDGLLDLSYYKSLSNYYCDFSSSYIQSLAYNLTKTCIDDLEKSISIHNYVSRVNYDYYGGAVNSALNTLLSFEGNCVDQSSSLVALARAVSLPVRYVIGQPIEEGKDEHAWAQICIDNVFIVSDPTNVNSFGDGSIVSQVYTGYEYGVIVTTDSNYSNGAITFC